MEGRRNAIPIPILKLKIGPYLVLRSLAMSSISASARRKLVITEKTEGPGGNFFCLLDLRKKEMKKVRMRMIMRISHDSIIISNSSQPNCYTSAFTLLKKIIYYLWSIAIFKLNN
uniref:Putative ovule protein n=1 Tax=Solanum chacoense TaxID=4108 RepID=A0A0V0GYH3_SOLCH